MNEQARARKKTRERFFRVRRAEVQYARQLRQVADQVGAIVKGFAPGGFIENVEKLTHTLHRYSELLFPWAQSVAGRMVAEVGQRDYKAWTDQSKEMGLELRKELRSAPTGKVLRSFLDEQVSLITSLPREAAQRVHRLTLENITTAGRAKTIANEILRTGEVTKARANTIARTEVSRTATGLVEARALYVGSEGYIWRSAEDTDVRPIHKKLNGKFFRWDSPPVAGENGERAHPGMIYNCFPGDTLVSPDKELLTVLRGAYCGPLIEFFTADSFFRVTPNHPVLTRTGWRAAFEVEVGEYLFKEFTQRSNVRKNNVDERLRTLAEIYESFAAHGETSVNSEHGLYGDFLVNNKVNVVRPALYLPRYGVSVFDERSSEYAVASADSRVSGVFESRIFSQISEPSSPRFGSVGGVIGNSARSHHGTVGVCDRSDSNILFDQNFADSHSAAAVPLRDSGCARTTEIVAHDLLRRKIGSISGTSRVLRKNVVSFSGHVYTLQTVCGYYNITAANLIVKNCRCYPEVVIPDEM